MKSKVHVQDGITYEITTRRGDPCEFSITLKVLRIDGKDVYDCTKTWPLTISTGFKEDTSET